MNWPCSQRSIHRGKPRRATAVAAVVLTAVIAGPSAPSSANAPPGHYQDAANGTGVLDTKTGLTWQRVMLGQPIDWVGAKVYCSELGLDGGGWRLPTATELSSLVDETVPSPGPTIDVNWFPDTPSAHLWSSSPVVGVPFFVWYVYFCDGKTTNGGDVANDKLYVRCVR